MTEQEQTTLHTEGVIGDYFIIESHILSTRSADAYKAVDRSRNSPVCLWMLRFPLAVNSDAVRRFLDRMSALDQIDPPVTEMLAYGVDAQGAAFTIFPSLDGHICTAGNIETAEAERRFMAAARLVDMLHTHNIPCGDLCASSFWVNRTGDLRFLGTMGSFESEAAATSMAPPQESMPFLAPEQRAGGLELASDIFALGALGYYLMTRQYPYGEGMELMASNFDINSVRKISDVIPVPPVWANEVILKCIDPDPAARYQNAGAVISAIKEIRARVFSEETSPVSRTPKGIGVPAAPDINQGVQSFSPPMLHKSQQQPEEEVGRKKRSVLPFILAFGVVVGAAIGVMFMGGAEEPQTNRLREELAQHQGAVTDQGLKDAMNVISVDNATLGAKKTNLDNIVNSDDPLAHDILVKSAREAESDQFRALSEKAIINRARRLGLLRSAEQVRQWLRTIPRGLLPADYEPILKCLDKSLPREARFSALRQAYASNPRVATRIAVAIALDMNELEESQPLIAQLVGDSLGVDDARKYSSLSLVLAHHDLALVFGEDVIQKRDQIPDGDILWLLKRLAERNDINVRAVASMAVDRGLLPPVRATFLSVIRDRGDLSSEVLDSLIRAAAGVLTDKDIAHFGRWYDMEVEKVLLAICADYQDEKVLKEAFDTLAARTVSAEPASSMIEWIRANYWESRAEFASVVGILSFLDIATDQDLERVFNLFDRYVRDSDLIEILLDTDDPKILKLVIKRYDDQLGLGTLLDLLDTPDKAVRISVVKSLKKYNDLGVLKMILDRYDQEQDPEVRKVYQDSFWTIREREITEKANDGKR